MQKVYSQTPNLKYESSAGNTCSQEGGLAPALPPAFAYASLQNSSPSDCDEARRAVVRASALLCGCEHGNYLRRDHDRDAECGVDVVRSGRYPAHYQSHGYDC